MMRGPTNDPGIPSVPGAAEGIGGTGPARFPEPPPPLPFSPARNQACWCPFSAGELVADRFFPKPTQPNPVWSSPRPRGGVCCAIMVETTTQQQRPTCCASMQGLEQQAVTFRSKRGTGMTIHCRTNASDPVKSTFGGRTCARPVRSHRLPVPPKTSGVVSTLEPATQPIPSPAACFSGRNAP